MSKQTFPQGFCLFSGCACEGHIEEAKRYVESFHLTNIDVKIICNNENVLVMTKREVTLRS